MNQTHLSLAILIQKVEFRHISAALWQGALNFGKSLVTWEGRSVSQIKEAEFLRNGAWEENLILLSSATNLNSVTALTTKEFYCWQPKETYILEGFSSTREQKNAKASHSFMRWLQIGAVAGVAYGFFKAMQFNFTCLGEFDERSCRVMYGELLSHPSTWAKAAFASGWWILGGWMMSNLGDFGLRGFIKEKKLMKDLMMIYKLTAESARASFWRAVDNQDKPAAQKIYDQAKLIKNTLDFYTDSMMLNMGISAKDVTAIINPFHLLVEDLLSNDIDTLFPSLKAQEENHQALISQNHEETMG